MKSGKSAAILIVNAILWAAAMLGSSILLDDSKAYGNIFLLLFTLWMASFLMLQEGRESIECEWRYLRKIFSWTRKIK